MRIITWRIVLENPQSGEKSVFGNFKELAIYLQQVLEVRTKFQ